MAQYKHAVFLSHITDNAFDLLHHPGTPTPLSGIYRCHVCGHEAVSTRHHPLPPQNHHTHGSGAAIQWRLIVASTHA